MSVKEVITAIPTNFTSISLLCLFFLFFFYLVLAKLIIQNQFQLGKPLSVYLLFAVIVFLDLVRLAKDNGILFSPFGRRRNCRVMKQIKIHKQTFRRYWNKNETAVNDPSELWWIIREKMMNVNWKKNENIPWDN